MTEWPRRKSFSSPPGRSHRGEEPRKDSWLRTPAAWQERSEKRPTPLTPASLTGDLGQAEWEGRGVTWVRTAWRVEGKKASRQGGRLPAAGMGAAAMGAIECGKSPVRCIAKPWRFSALIPHEGN